jgi:hypothetical protein
MKTGLKFIGLFFAFAMLLSSCSMGSDDDVDDIWSGIGDGNTGNFVIGHATVEGTANNFRLILDNGTVLVIYYNNVVIPENSDFGNGTRVIANFTVLGTGENNGVTYWSVRLNALTQILCKTPVFAWQSDISQNDMGYDPIDVDKVWFGGKYLNVNFYLYTGSSSLEHFINLWVDAEHPDADEDNVYVEMRHNAYNDQQSSRVFGQVSFDISDLLPKEKSSITVHFTYTDYSGRTYTKSGEYTKKTVESVGNEAYARPATALIN